MLTDQQRAFAKVLDLVEEAGCMPHVVLVGSWAEYVYREAGLLAGFEPNIRTTEEDSMPVAADARCARAFMHMLGGLEVLDDLTLDDFEAMARLEARYYGEDYITPAAEAFAWYRRFPDTTVAVGDRRGRIAGFVNLFPVRDGVYAALRAGTFNDRDLTVDDMVVPGEGGRAPAADPAPRALHMFLSCIVVDEAYRHGGAVSHALLREAVRRYGLVEGRADAVLVDTVTSEGARFARRWGFAPVCASDHGSQVFEQPYADFARRVREDGPA